MIRILHVITGLNQGAAERMLVRLLLGLDRGTFDQKVVSLADRGAFGETIEAAGIPLANLGMTGFQTIPRTLQRLRRVISAYQPDIAQTWLYRPDLLGLVAAKLPGDAAVVWNIRCAGLAPGDAPRSIHWLIRLLAWRIVRARPTARGGDFDDVIDHIRHLEKARFAVFPLQSAEAVAARTDHAVLWGAHGYGFRRLEGFFPVLTRPLEAFFLKYGIEWVLWDSTFWPQGESTLVAHGLVAADSIKSFGRWRLVKARDESER